MFFKEDIMSAVIAMLGEIHPILVCLLVCIAKALEICIQSVKTCLLVKGQKLRAAFLGFCECMVWGLVISTIISTLGDNFLLLLFYGFGYSVGLYVGSMVDSHLAFGTSNIELIANEASTKVIVAYLKEHNKGFTVLNGYGATEKMNMIYIVLPRKEVLKTIADIKKIASEHVFFVTSEVSKYNGGYGVSK